MKKIIIVLLIVLLGSAMVVATFAKDQNLTGITKLRNGTVNAVILGDSIAVSQGASDPLTTGWNSELKTSLFNKYANNIVWDNKASAGHLIDYSLQRATEIVSTTDAVFICSGRIDRNFDTPDQFGKKYAQLINDIKSRAPNADIFCIVEPPMISSDESLFLGIRTAIIDVSANTGSNLLDVWSTFPQNQVDLVEYLLDGLHPNDKGYKLMSDYIYNQIVKVINEVKRRKTVIPIQQFFSIH
ncbi:SGNH/GDSL hydrolase family protein [Desulfosporosinus youngiae]|uniref:Lysophospholipase L1-like esterase n=1 Tax=Desulfosporosinus youngiae DSM 17734 TaxID=768710 RepID=H5XRY9_9FIRM|nr:SGNH/GDSL hydrolase family protein [Desulfosporosinus youngiae]EHQ87526.1 lysophospholipase L1-like esterase [Desulfosporosinus youngiae DSM 17734]